MQGFSIQSNMTVKEWSFSRTRAVNATYLLDVRRPSMLRTKTASSTGFQLPSTKSFMGVANALRVWKGKK